MREGEGLLETFRFVTGEGRQYIAPVPRVPRKMAWHPFVPLGEPKKPARLVKRFRTYGRDRRSWRDERAVWRQSRALWEVNRSFP